MSDWRWTLDLLERKAGVYPDREVVWYEPAGRWYTYGELNSRARRLANALTAGLGLKKGDRVAVLARNIIEYFDFFFATQKTGLVLVPLNLRLSPDELTFMIKLTGPKVLAYEADFAALAAQLAMSPGVEAAIRIGRGTDTVDAAGAIDYQELLAKARDAVPDASPIDLADPHLLLFTGGTTGLPKAAILSHRAFYFNMVSEAVCWDLGPNSTAPNMLPFFHTGGWNLLTLPLIFAGGRLLLDRGFDPQEILDWIPKHRITMLFGAATMYHMMEQLPSFAKTDLSSLECVMSGAAACPRPVMEPFWDRGTVFVQGMGITEGGPNNLFMPWKRLSWETMKAKWRSVGIPFMYCQAKVVDEEGHQTKPDELGELLLSGPVVFSGYWQNEKATADTLIDGWVHTGDIAAVDADGFFYIMDRKKDMFISGGENVFPVEVEAVLSTHPKVSEVAVIGVPDDKWGEVGKAFIVPRPGHNPTPEELAQFLQGKIARYKIPKHYTLTDSLPKSGVGKILKRVLRESKSA